MEDTTNNPTPEVQVPETPAVVPSAVAPATTPVSAPVPGGEQPGQGRAAFRSGRGSFGQRGRGGRPGGRGGRPMRNQEKPEYDQKTLDIARVARVTKGGKRFSFRATVVAGNGKGKVGVGIAKGKDVQGSIQKAYHQAKKNLVTVITKDGTIPYQVQAKYSSAVVLLKPSKSGIKAGGAVRTVAQMAGIQSLTGKLTERTNNKLNIARATIMALKMIRAPKNQ